MSSAVTDGREEAPGKGVVSSKRLQALPGILPGYLAFDLGGMREASEAARYLVYILLSSFWGLVHPSLSLSLQLISTYLPTLSRLQRRKVWVKGRCRTTHKQKVLRPATAKRSGTKRPLWQGQWQERGAHMGCQVALYSAFI